MLVNSPSFNIEVMAYWYDNNNLLSIIKQDSLFNEKINFKKLKLITQVSEFPIFELTISDLDWASLCQIKKLDFTIEFKDQKVIKFSGTPIVSRMKSTEIKWIGYLGDPELVFHTKSEYLSDSWKNSINDLAGRFNLKYTHTYDYISEDGFYIFNETPKSALLRILSAVGNNYQYAITFDECKLLSPSESELSSSIEMTNELEKFMLLDNQEKINIITSINPFSSYEPANEYEVFDDNYYRTSDDNLIHHNYQQAGVKSYIYNKSYNENILSGIKYLENYQLQNILQLPRYVDIDIGNKLNYPRKYTTPFWVVISKEVSLDLSSITTVLKLGNDKKEFV